MQYVIPIQTNRFQNTVEHRNNSAQAFHCCLFITFLPLFAEKSWSIWPIYSISWNRKKKKPNLQGFQRVRRLEAGGRSGRGKPRISSFVPPHPDSKCLDHATLASKPSDGDSYSYRVLKITKLVFLDLQWFLLVWKVAKQIQHKQFYDAWLNYIRLNLWQSLSARGGTPAVRSWMCHCSKRNTATITVPVGLINKNITWSPLKRKLFPFKHCLTICTFAIMKWDYLLQKSFTQP